MVDIDVKSEFDTLKEQVEKLAAEINKKVAEKDALVNQFQSLNGALMYLRGKVQAAGLDTGEEPSTESEQDEVLDQSVEYPPDENK
tara:strand:+ start:8726 stop:8983 length:258 start_codon:yes stop_codon:yes gene_type:complete